MKFSLYRLVRLMGVGLAGVTLAQGCSASNDGSAGPSTAGQGGKAGTGGVSVIMPDGGPPTMEGGASGISPLCGVTLDGCDPDQVLACASYSGSQVGKLTLGPGGAGGLPPY